MAEYINRETLLKAVEKMDRLDKETNTKYEYNKEGYVLLIESAPTADVVEVKHGEWVDNGIQDSVLSKCSVCGFDCGAYTFNYCPHCGAKMDGGNNG